MGERSRPPSPGALPRQLPPSRKKAARSATRAPAARPHVRKGSFAPNYDVGLTMLFDDPAGYLTYAESKGHQEFFAKYCTPILAERVVVQFHERT